MSTASETPQVAAKNAEISALTAEIGACRLCAEAFAETHTAHAPRPVVRASATARLCIAGQAPGLRVHRSGLPFDDPSGDRLRAWLGVERETFYDARRIAILPMAFCFPGYTAKGADLPPPKRCAQTWRTRLMTAHAQLELILLVGQYAQAWHLGASRHRTLTETVAAWRDYLDAVEPVGPRFLPLPHPSWRNNSWLKKNSWFDAELLPRLQQETARLVNVGAPISEGTT